MPRTFVDLSIFLENDVLSDPPAFAPKIEYFSQDNTFEQIAPFFPGLQKSDLPDGEGWAVELVQLSTHNGTHLDAPYHFHSTMNKALGEKERAIAIHEVPLEWCFQPGVKLDFRHFADGYVVTAADVETELERVGHTIAPLEIVVVNTRAGSRYGASDYVASGCGMGYEATMYLLERGVRLTGTDAWSWDAPFVHTVKKYGESHDASLIWEGHKAGRDIGYCHLDRDTPPYQAIDAAAASRFRSVLEAIYRPLRADSALNEAQTEQLVIERILVELGWGGDYLPRQSLGQAP